MDHIRQSVRWVAWAAGLALAILGTACESQTSAEDPAKPTPKAQEPAKTPVKKTETTQTAEPKRTQLGKNVFFEVLGDQRRVVINATVCYRGPGLEGLLTIKGTKDHEYVLAMEADGKVIHAALLATGAKVGTPVKFEPKYTPPTGTVVKVSVRYTKDGKAVTVPAQQWIRDSKAKKDLDNEWVFAGSYFVNDPDDPKRIYYAANGGDVICTINMPGAMLDLPIKNPNSDPGLGDRRFEANPDRVPKEGTWVEVILEPVIEKKDKSD